MPLAQLGKKDEIYGDKTLFRELAYYILRVELYENSLMIFDEAIKRTPDDIRALVGRSRSRAKLSQYEGALEDVNRALKVDPSNLEVLAEKALNTYLSCEFETGLVQNSRLLPRRQKPEHFSLGTMHCSNAIETCIGEPAGRPLRDHFKIIRRLAWDKNRKVLEGYTKKQKRKKPVMPFYVDDTPEAFAAPIKSKKHEKHKMKSSNLSSNIVEDLQTHESSKNIVPPFKDEFPFEPLQKYTSNLENFMAEKYLESMYLDKNFLKKIGTQPGTCSPNQKGSEKIRHLAKTGYKMVAYKQELLRTRRPFYHIKYKEGFSTTTLKIRQAQELFIQQQTARKEAEMLLLKFQDYFKQNKFRDLSNYAEKIMNYCDSKPKRILPDRDVYLEEVFETIRKGRIQLHRINHNQYPWDQVKRIQMAFGLPVSREPSNDSVLEEVKPVFTDYKKELRNLEKRLKEQAQSSDEICWCYYEMCHNSIMMKKYEIARIYAKQCIQHAKLTENSEWIFITTMLLVRMNVEQRNINDASNEISNAKEIAKELDNQSLVNYTEKCLEVVNSIDLDTAQTSEVLMNRQNKILALVENAKLKDEFSYLFRMMSSMPASRRMPVIPGVVASSDSDAKQAGRKSAFPTSGLKDDRAKEQVDKLSTKRKVKTSKGVGFMDLIEDHVD